MRRTDEITVFKTQISLSAYAAGGGYRLDKKASSRNCAVMRSGSDKIVIIKSAKDGHWLYFSVHDEQDNGSIIDFVQNRQSLNLGQVRMELRPWLGKNSMPQMAAKVGEDYVADLLPLSKDLGQVRAKFTDMRAIDGTHSYLQQERKLPFSFLSHPKFASRIYIDGKGNAVFPHFNREGVCGYELKNHSFTGFAPGGEKGLWCSRTEEVDRVLVIGEAALDVLSYAALFAPEAARYVSTGGTLNPNQPILLESALKKMPEDSEIILAVDNDEGGQTLASKIQAIYEQNCPARGRLRIHAPDNSGEDWNDVLKASVQVAQDLERTRKTLDFKMPPERGKDEPGQGIKI